MRHPESYFDVIQLLSLEFLNLLLLNDGSVPISSAIETINALPDRHICPEFLIFFAPLAARSNLWSPKIDIPIICLAVTRELDSQLLILNGHNVANGPAFAFESGIDLDCFDRVALLQRLAPCPLFVAQVLPCSLTLRKYGILRRQVVILVNPRLVFEYAS